MNRYVSRIVGKVYKIMKNAAAKSMGAKYLAGKTFTMEQMHATFQNFVELSETKVRANNYKNVLTIDLEFRQPINYPTADRKPFAGMVNEGTTCYLNSVMQSLFMMNPFRRAIYELKVDPDELKDIKLCI